MAPPVLLGFALLHAGLMMRRGHRRRKAQRIAARRLADVDYTTEYSSATASNDNQNTNLPLAFQTLIDASTPETQVLTRPAELQPISTEEFTCPFCRTTLPWVQNEFTALAAHIISCITSHTSNSNPLTIAVPPAETDEGEQDEEWDFCRDWAEDTVSGADHETVDTMREQVREVNAAALRVAGIPSAQTPVGSSSTSLSVSSAEAPLSNRQLHPVRLYYRAIRGSRKNRLLEKLAKPFSSFSHWTVEVEGVYYELREDTIFRGTDDGRIVLVSDAGPTTKRIKFEATTNRKPLRNSRCIVVGHTRLNRLEIATRASTIFRNQFRENYDLFIDNCQTFCQRLCESIVDPKDVPATRHVLEKRSTVILPGATSLLMSPFYLLASGLQDLVAKTKLVSSARSLARRDRVVARSETFLRRWDQVYYHWKVYKFREKHYHNRLSALRGAVGFPRRKALLKER